MPITNVIINTTDVARSLDFYTKFVQAEPVGEPTADRAILDLVTATLEVRRVDGSSSSWIPDDLQLGFRHIGFKVDQIDPRAEALRAADVPFHLDPLDATGGVRICFFYDPDGTLLEFVAGDLQYAAVHDPEGVRAERALGVPERPRFDHVAVTVHDRVATAAFYAPLDFSLIGTIEQPQDPRGFSIGYLKSGDTVLEVFTYDSAKQERPPQLDAPGFRCVELAGVVPDGAQPLSTDGAQRLLVDPNSLVFAVSGESPSL
jgi:catechol 2,3-dioxygenase-like lactoylglutathione lyase family enzyme